MSSNSVSSNNGAGDITYKWDPSPSQEVNVTLSLDDMEIESLEYGNTVKWEGTVEGVKIHLNLMAQDPADYTAGTEALYERRLEDVDKAYEAVRDEYENMSYDEFMEEFANRHGEEDQI
jgi:hypothetical protein